MTVAANQPYLFPYLGYFQLIAAADVFVMSDSMQYVIQSWMNRNRLLVKGEEFLMVSPVRKAPLGTPVNGMEYCSGFFEPWLRCMKYDYARAPYFPCVMTLMESLRDMEIRNVADFNIKSIEHMCAYLDIDTKIVRLSRLMDIPSGDKTEKTIGIVERCGGDRYLNLPGGRALYSPADFACRGIELRFLEPYLPPYRQVRAHRFHPGLSIIDVIMNCSPEQVRSMIDNANFT